MWGEFTGWLARGISAGDAHQSEEKSQFFAEHLLSNKLIPMSNRITTNP
jgi:hypothetical protein